MRRAVRVHLTDPETRQLRSWSQASERPASRARRAKIVLMAAEGWTNQAIASALAIHPETVALWRRRFVSNRLEGIRMDAPRSGHGRRSARLKARIVSAAGRNAGEHGRGWTTRTLAKRFRVSHMTVYRAWRAHSMQQAKASDRVQDLATTAGPDPVEMEGVFLHPPRRAAVFQVDGQRRLPSGGVATSAPIGRETDGRGDPGRGLSALFDRWKKSATDRAGSVRSVAELLVFLRMVERRAPASSTFMVLYEGFSRTAEQRVERWARSHPRFYPVRVPAGTTWLKAVERCVGTWGSGPLASPWDRIFRPLTESLASYLQADPAALPPFVWTAPSLGEGPSGPAGPAPAT